MARVVILETPDLGDRSYLAHDGDVAVVIDPQRDIDRVLEAAREAGVRITHVFETHVHNDYVTGGLALAAATGAAHVGAAADPVAYDRVPARDGSTFRTGRLTVTAMATPGHTPNHLAYRLAEDGDDRQAVFTGGSMLFGAVGRTDLVDPRRTDELTRAQYHSVRRLAADLPPDTDVHPTHGFGSFCAATETTGDSSTVGRQRTDNIALTVADEETFVEILVAGLGAYPRYYEHMSAANLAGPLAPDPGDPPALDAAAVRRRIEDGEWVVDLRHRHAFADRHVSGTISVELTNPFTTFLGWTKPWDTPLSLIASAAGELGEARRRLVRIGIDRLAGAAIGTTERLAAGRIASYPVVSFGDLGGALERHDVVVLDVRRPDEWHQGHLHGAVHVPFWELEARVGELPPGEIWVHCASGFRASISASILDRAGRQAVLVDGDWDEAGRLDLPVV